jgi:hypothetical protein
MRLSGVLAAVVALLAANAAAASGQSLGDVARQEAERRKNIKSSAKVLTNESLRPEPTPSSPAPAPASPPAAGAPAQPASGQPASVSGAPAGDAPASAEPTPPVQDQAAWRKKITDARDALSRAQIFAEALQSRINALSTDFVNRDDPAQRNVIAAERQKALAELDRVKQDIQNQQKAITTIQDDARKAGVPAGWVR